jgi:hypothetical protein
MYLEFMLIFFADDQKVEEVKDTLTEDLQKMLDNPAFYPDVVFKVGSTTIRAHKCILSVRCVYFDSYVPFPSYPVLIFMPQIVQI